MTHQLPDLPYDFNALEPHISAQTLEFHYGKHHQGYVNNLNKLVQGTEFDDLPLEDIIKQTAGKSDKVGIFNNAAQTWNHTFYWNSMKPNGGGEPSAEIKKLILESFGDWASFEEQFKQAATTQFGSGWAWVVYDQGKIMITKTSNADSPLTQDQIPLLTCDVWEHAYYLDYQNRRPDYVEKFFTELVNWDFVEENLKHVL